MHLLLMLVGWLLSASCIIYVAFCSLGCILLVKVISHLMGLMIMVGLVLLIESPLVVMLFFLVATWCLRNMTNKQHIVVHTSIEVKYKSIDNAIVGLKWARSLFHKLNIFETTSHFFVVWLLMLPWYILRLIFTLSMTWLLKRNSKFNLFILMIGLLMFLLNFSHRVDLHFYDPS